MNKYLAEFLNLKCAGDVLNTVAPITRMEKEITESMAIIKLIRPVTLAAPMKYTLFDLCAGNALTSVLACYLLPVKQSVAFDIKPRVRAGYKHVKRFTYEQSDIRKDCLVSSAPTITVSVHACRDLADHVLFMAAEHFRSDYAAIMTCCIGRDPMPFPHIDFLTKAQRWALMHSLKYGMSLKQDKHVMSPANYIIYGKPVIADVENEMHPLP